MSPSARAAFFVLIAALPVGPAWAQALAPPSPASARFAVTDVSVVDVAAGALLPAQTVLIEDGRITWVGAAADATVPDGATRVDGRGRFLMPGLWDAHVHYIDPDGFGAMFLGNGVTFVRDMGNETDLVVACRDQIRRRERIGPEMLVCGRLLDGPKPVWPFSEKCPDAAAARAAVQKLARQGVDQLKVYQLLPADAFRAIVAEAKVVGLPIVGHIPDSITFREALGAGYLTIEHLMGFEQVIGELTSRPAAPHASVVERFGVWAHWREVDRNALRAWLQRVVESGVTLCPTLVAGEGLARAAAGEKDPLMEYVPAQFAPFWKLPAAGAEALAFARQARPALLELIRELHRAGVPLIAGTDLPNPLTFAGFSLHRELELFQEAGLAPADVLRCAITAPARTFGLAGRIGAVAAGKTASLVLLRANPLTDVRHAREIDGVFHQRAFHDRAALDRLLAEARDRIAMWAPADREVALSLPGKVVARGRYRLTFLGNPAGTEEFLITEDAGGLHVGSHCRIEGGFIQPSVTVVHAGADGSFRSASYEQLSKLPTVANYDWQEGKLVARARLGDVVQPGLDIDVPRDAVVGSVGVAVRFLALRALALERGGEKQVQALAVGVPDWRPTLAPALVERLSDTVLRDASGAELAVARYDTTLTLPIGKYVTKEWVDRRGVVVKSEIATVFGKIAAVLE